MKRIYAGVLILSVFGSAQAHAAETAKETSAKEAQAAKESYVKKANQEVQEWSSKIQSLEERSRESGSKIREDLDRHFRMMRAHFQDIRNSLQELTGSGDGAWTSLRRGFEESTQKLSKDYDKAVSSFKKSEKRASDKVGVK